MSMKSKVNKNKLKNSNVDARQTNNNYYSLSEEHIREAERYNEKAKYLAKDLKSMHNELDKATKQYRLLTEKVAKVSKEHPVPGHENMNLVKLEKNQERLLMLVCFLVILYLYNAF